MGGFVALRSRRGQPGVTLVEILMALAVLSLVLVSVLQVIPLGFVANIKGRNRAICTQIAQQRLEMILYNPAGDGSPYSGAVDMGPTYNSCAPEAPEYYYNTRVVTVLDPNLKYQVNILLNRDNNYITNHDVAVGTQYGKNISDTAWQPTTKRITVTVIGPAESAATFLNTDPRKRRGAMVTMATYITDRHTGLGVIDRTDLALNCYHVVGLPTFFNTPGPDGIRYFSVFNYSRLTFNEVSDCGPSLVYPNDKNLRGLDNVKISHSPTAGVPPDLTVPDQVQTNRIINILKDQGITGNGWIFLEQPIQGIADGAQTIYPLSDVANSSLNWVMQSLVTIRYKQSP